MHIITTELFEENSFQIHAVIKNTEDKIQDNESLNTTVNTKRF